MADAPGLPNFTNAEGVFEARRVPRALSSDLVIYWSTNASPGDLVTRCSAFTHADLLSHVEVIADEDVIKVEDVNQLISALKGRSLVRFNVSNWTITWMGKTKTESAEIQAVFGTQPAAMSEMVKQSISGHSSPEVDKFFEQLKLCLAPTA